MDMVSLMYGPQERTWQTRANCMGVDPDLFFPERGASTREAKEVCRGCVVREDCLEYALANGEKFGIWGGLSERERRRSAPSAGDAAESGQRLLSRAGLPGRQVPCRARRDSMVSSARRSSSAHRCRGTASRAAAGTRPTSSARRTEHPRRAAPPATAS